MNCLPMLPMTTIFYSHSCPDIIIITRRSPINQKDDDVLILGVDGSAKPDHRPNNWNCFFWVWRLLGLHFKYYKGGRMSRIYRNDKLLKYMMEVIVICMLFLLVCSIAQQEDQQSEDAVSRRLAASNQKPCVKWGNTFDVSLSSKNLIRNCALPDGRPICCSALLNYSKADPFAKPVGFNYHPIASKKDYSGFIGEKKDDRCSLHKEYISSAQELRDLAYSKIISKISDDHTDSKRLDALMKYVLSAETLRNASRWLDRVKVHMQDEAINLQHYSNSSNLDTKDFHPDDFEFLSRFEVTRTCGSSVEKWVEWIEPLTITARHPYAFGRCRPVAPYLEASTPRTDRSNVDYVLLQSGKSLHDQSYYRNGRRIVYGSEDPAVAKRQRYSQVKHFMLDSGTSTFDSSLFWFTCAFAQVINFRHIH